jgi:hypothetical protein
MAQSFGRSAERAGLSVIDSRLFAMMEANLRHDSMFHPEVWSFEANMPASAGEAAGPVAVCRVTDRRELAVSVLFIVIIAAGHSFAHPK